jgi:2-octaprenyl-6-methoxyphenol hydroxylase
MKASVLTEITAPVAHPLPPALHLGVVGAGPVGLALAIHAAQCLPQARVTTLDARSADADVGRDPRTLALSLGSVQLLQRLGAWPEVAATSITQVHVSQEPSAAPGPWAEPVVRFSAAEQGVERLGAVVPYGALTACLQARWLALCERERHRLAAQFSAAVVEVRTRSRADPGGEGAAEVQLADKQTPDAAAVARKDGRLEHFDVAVVAEGGVFGSETAQARADSGRRVLQADYGQTAWVGEVKLARAHGGVAFERFTRQGPVALLPLQGQRAALVWCTQSESDPVETLSDSQRLAVLRTLFHADVGELVSLSALKKFPLGLLAELSLVQGRVVRLGNAAQTLHPVAGQGLNLGLRDAFEWVRCMGRVQVPGEIDAALARVQWQRAPDRWALIAATDFLARSFTWALPGAAVLRGAGLAALAGARPLRSLLARQMMFGRR